MSAPEPVLADETPRKDEPIAGPSFLGLADEAPAEEHSLDYLYEDESPPRYGRLIVALLVLVGFGVFIAYQWKQLPNWRTALNRTLNESVTQRPPEKPSADPAPAPMASSPSGAPAAAPSQAAQQVGSGTGTVSAQLPQADVEQTSSVPPDKREETSPSPPPADETSTLLAKGLAYLDGTGVPRSCSQALVFLNSAAEKGNAKANSQLGGLYATGHCVPMDRARAWHYFTRARNTPGGRNVYIDHNREMLWSQMSEEEKAQARAMP